MPCTDYKPNSLKTLSIIIAHSLTWTKHMEEDISLSTGSQDSKTLTGDDMEFAPKGNDSSDEESMNLRTRFPLQYWRLRRKRLF